MFLRGDHSVNETKLLSTVSGRELRTMNAEELEKYLHGPAGYLGPVGLKAKKVANPGADLSAFTDGEVVVVMDLALEGRTNLVCGANELDYHFRNITPGRDFQPTLTADIRSVNEGEGCPVCGAPLKLGKAVEIGHIFKLGYRYSKSMGATVLNQDGKEVMPIMGCYGIGIERILTAAVEQNHDANGFWLARSIAPFDVVVTVTNVGDANLVATAEQVALGLEGAGFDVLLDDRDERAGVKFKDADLVGVPFRINIGKKVAEGRVELVTRSTASSQDVAIAEVVPRLREIADSV